jgi:hypothetical protein
MRQVLGLTGDGKVGDEASECLLMSGRIGTNIHDRRCLSDGAKSQDTAQKYDDRKSVHHLSFLNPKFPFVRRLRGPCRAIAWTIIGTGCTSYSVAVFFLLCSFSDQDGHVRKGDASVHQWGEPVKGCALSLSAPGKLAAGEAVVVTVTFRNGSQGVVRFPSLVEMA